MKLDITLECVTISEQVHLTPDFHQREKHVQELVGTWIIDLTLIDGLHAASKTIRRTMNLLILGV